MPIEISLFDRMSDLTSWMDKINSQAEALKKQTDEAYEKLSSCDDPEIKDDLRMRYRQLVNEQSALEKRRDLEARIKMGTGLKSSSK